MSHTLYFYATCQEKIFLLLTYLKISRYVCNCLISITFHNEKKNLEFNISTDVSLNFVLHQNESNIRYITFKYFFNIVYLKCSKYKSRRTMTGILKGKSLTVTTQEHTRIALLVLRRNQNFTTKLWYSRCKDWILHLMTKHSMVLPVILKQTFSNVT